MPRPLPPGYFGAPPFAGAGPELFASYTCLGCGARAAAWAAFRAHRRECPARSEALEAAARVGQLAALLAPGDRDDRDPFLDAPAAALRLLEAWEAWQRAPDHPEAPGLGPAAAGALLGDGLPSATPPGGAPAARAVAVSRP
jgi:hypothetical protein